MGWMRFSGKRWTDSLTSFRQEDIKQFSINFSLVAVTSPIDFGSIEFSSYRQLNVLQLLFAVDTPKQITRFGKTIQLKIKHFVNIGKRSGRVSRAL